MGAHILAGDALYFGDADWKGRASVKPAMSKDRKDKVVLLGVMTGASVPRSSPRLLLLEQSSSTVTLVGVQPNSHVLHALI